MSKDPDAVAMRTRRIQERQARFGDETASQGSKRRVRERVLDMCREQGVNPEDTLTADDVKKFMTLNHAEKNIINLISSGFPVRHANAILRSIDMKLERSVAKAQTVSEVQGITVTINTLSDTPTVSTTLTAGTSPAKDSLPC